MPREPLSDHLLLSAVLARSAAILSWMVAACRRTLLPLGHARGSSLRAFASTSVQGHVAQCGRVEPAASEALGSLELIRDIEDPRLALYRSRHRRDPRLHQEQALRVASEALFRAGLIPESERRRLPVGPWAKGELKQLRCVVSVHYTWDCIRQLHAAQRERGGTEALGVFVGSALIPTETPDELVHLARQVCPETYMVSRGLFEPEFSQDMDPEFGREPALQETREAEAPVRAVWRRYEGGAAKSTVRFAVAFPVTQPLAEMRPPFVILDGLSSASNIGQILRTAYHFGVVSVVAARASWNSLNGRACRVSMGWLYRMSFHLADRLPEALMELKGLGVQIYAAENQFARPVSPHTDRNWALVLGHEGLGISDEAVALSDARICIPQEQGLCLNVAHAASICLYELSRNHIHAG